MMLFILFLSGAVLAIGPWLELVPGLTTPARITMSALGTIVLIAVIVVAVITKLYRKASANMAYVKTGMGGADVIMDAGRVIVPVVHQIIPVSLETMRLNVERRGPHALITKDNLRVDLSAEFYIKVQATREDILQAARSLGGRNVQPDAVSELVQEKLVSALRTVAATKDLVELHAKRDEFASAVQQIVTHDLASNGLTLESVTISSLDQTDPTALQERNVFDAQGLRKIAEITQKARVERNEIERDAEKQVQEKNVSTSKKVLDLQRDQAEFEAEQRTKISNVQAARQREVAEFKLTQDEAVARRDIEKNKAVETAEREKDIVVAEMEQQRAAAQASVLTAEAEREKAKQQVVTVTVTTEAEREAQKKLIAAQQQVKEKQIREQTDADVLAYTKVKQAESERQAAQMQYEARLRLAEADAQGATKRAEGERAVKMVDVNVEREKVNIEQARVEVERTSLANKSEFEEAALNFELEKLRIEAEKQVRIAAAEALSKMLAGANMQIFADPDTMTRMSENFMRAASLGNSVDGLLRTMPPKGQELLTQLAATVTSALKPADVPQPVAPETSGNGVATKER